ncbi:usherin [Elysia marginata]|uniref:Usherin n=1 Tax=Elysia marginata TaxID=1093978 RepID=A0AAV4GBC8_9GAST|nr:usherin [Elysia marginata]
MPNNGALSSPDDVNCLQFGTHGVTIPYSQGGITFNLLAPDPVARPGSNDFYGTPTLHEFVKARKVKVKFQDHYYVTNILHQYYAVYEFIVNAWCDCNGHASSCDTSVLPYTCDCLPSSNTQGLRCDSCKPLFNNKPFRKGDNRLDNICQPCTCYGHAQSCVYNVTIDPVPESHTEGGGGVCVNCQHNTVGRFCDACDTGYFRPVGISLSDPEVCQPCTCSAAGTAGGATDCVKVGGQCSCKANVEGRACDRCKPGFYLLTAANPDGCLPCSCNILGVARGDVSCNQLTGQCNCKANVQGLRCDECKNGFFSLTSANPDGCTACNCNPVGSTSIFCNPNDGQCLCKTRVQGVKCDECKDGFFNFTNGCDSCLCNARGKEDGTVCDKASGRCTCKRNTEGE